MIIQERLHAAFQQFGWVRIPETLHALAKEAAKHNLTYLEFLDKLLQEELAAKHERYLRTRTRLAKLPYHKTIDQFDFEFQPSIDERRIRDLATLRFVEHQENVILLGPPGVGKTHLAVALGMEAISQRKTVYFTSAHDLVQTLQDAHHNRSIQQKMRVYTKPDLLIIDEMGTAKWTRPPPTSSSKLCRSGMKKGLSF